ncbi:MAG: hypothetical protein H0U85_07630 [Gemmatimonadales bacterium]|nr:hypothetical protein [Gemmatimonadales bacterium]
MLSPSGWAEVPCAKCGTRVAGLDWGALCRDCVRERKRRANRISTIISLTATALTAAYVSFRIPADPGARLYAIVLVVAVYIITRRIATRVAMEALPR